MEYIFETSEVGVEVFHELIQKYPEQVKEMRHRNLLGDSGAVSFFVQMTPYILTALASVFVARLQSKSSTSVTLKLNGKELELKNVKLSEKLIQSFIEKVMKDEKNAEENL